MKFTIAIQQTRCAEVEVEAKNYLEATDKVSEQVKNNNIQWRENSLNFKKCMVVGKPLYHWISESKKSGRPLDELILEAANKNESSKTLGNKPKDLDCKSEVEL